MKNFISPLIACIVLSVSTSLAQPGTLDSSFGDDGKVLTQVGTGTEAGTSVAIQADGKIVEAGYTGNGVNTDFALVRYKSNGSLDKSFGQNGKVLTNLGSYNDICSTVALQADGKILAGGKTGNSATDFVLVRYKKKGSIDSSFGSNGKTVMSEIRWPYILMGKFY